MKKPVACSYLKQCYLAEDLKCYGYRTDCALYLKSNGQPVREYSFDRAMDKLIKRTKEKHELNQSTK